MKWQGDGVASLFEMQKKCKNMKMITFWPWTAADCETKTQQPTKNRLLPRRREQRGGTNVKERWEEDPVCGGGREGAGRPAHHQQSISNFCHGAQLRQ